MAVKKSAARKSAAKKATAKKSVAKKATTKKSAAKRAVKKTATKKAAVKKTAKNSSVRKAVKKSAVKKSAAKKSASISVPAVPVGKVRTAPRVDVSTTPAPVKPAAKPVAPAKPATKSGSSRTAIVLVFAIIILGLVVWSKSSSTTETAAPEATPTEQTSAEATPTESASAEATTTTEVTNGTSSSPAPERFIGNFRNSGSTLLLTWRAPAGAEGITGYNVEVRPANGEWASVEVVGADVFKYELQKSSDESWSQFRVSAVYSDGQASAKIFGFAGQWSK